MFPCSLAIVGRLQGENRINFICYIFEGPMVLIMPRYLDML